jgi:hypothetical protein
VQYDAFFLYADAGFGINRQGKVQGFCKGWLNLTHQTETSAKLGVDGGPGDGCWSSQ